jgi:hypothetical protein
LSGYEYKSKDFEEITRKSGQRIFFAESGAYEDFAGEGLDIGSRE